MINIKLEQKEIKKIKEILRQNKVVYIKSTIESYSKVVLKCENNNLYLYCENAVLLIKVFLFKKVLNNFVFCFDYVLLKKIIDSFNENEVCFLSCNNNVVFIKNNKKKFKLTTMVDYKQLMDEYVGEQDRIVIPSCSVNFMKSLVPFISKDDVRSFLKGCSLVVNDNVVIAASNGHQMVYKTIKNKNATKANSIILPLATINLLSTTHVDGNLEITFDSKKAVFKYGDIEITSKLIDSKFPDIVHLVPRGKYIEICVNCLKSFLKKIKKTVTYNKKISIEINENKVYLKTNDTALSTESIVDEAVVVEKKDKVSFVNLNSVYLRNALEQMVLFTDKENAVIRLYSDKKGINKVWLGFEKELPEKSGHVIMPMI